MGLVWAICGAGRGVGKTTLASNLQKVLPDSVYAKCGCGRIRTGRPPTFFNDLDRLRSYVAEVRRSGKHVVVESNSFAKCGDSDITIFIDGKPSERRSVRTDTPRLRQCADIVICRQASAAKWMDLLSARLSSERLARSVLQILSGQRCYLFGSIPQVGCRLWLEVDEQHVFGKGLARLFVRVDELGTLRKAAEAESMSYRYAWEMVRQAERHLGKTLLIRRVGGRGGGDSQLSPEGRLLLGAFQQLSEETSTFVQQRFQELYECSTPSP